jgi:hypothetical protein
VPRNGNGFSPCHHIQDFKKDMRTVSIFKHNNNRKRAHKVSVLDISIIDKKQLTMVKTREEAYKEIEELGYPILKTFDNFPPSMASKLLRIMSIVSKEECDHLTPAEVTVISAVISAANGCEI